MSYCRWSCDGGWCDIYAYEAEGDFWQIHIKTRKKVERSPVIFITVDGKMELSPTHAKEYREHNARMAALGDDSWVDLDLPFDGQDYQCETIEDFRDKMTELRAAGYQFPDYVFEQINEEIAEGLCGN